MTKKFTLFILLFYLIPAYSIADYPNTSIGVIDINKILSESDAAIMASEQIEKIASDIES